jgi:hypothetical protein
VLRFVAERLAKEERVYCWRWCCGAEPNQGAEARGAAKNAGLATNLQENKSSAQCLRSEQQTSQTALKAVRQYQYGIARYGRVRKQWYGIGIFATLQILWRWGGRRESQGGTN